MTETRTRERVQRPDASVKPAEIEKPASPSTEAAKADGGVGEGNDLSQSDIAGQAGDQRPAEDRALTGSRGPLSSDTASQTSPVGDDRADSKRYADEKVEGQDIVVPPAFDGKFPKVNFTKPYGVVATQVVDAAGRVVCHIGQSHLPMPMRENIAQFVAAKLNVE